MALKWLLFSEKLQKLPSSWGLRPQASIGVNCYLARYLHNQQLSKSLLQGFGINKCCNNATITAKPCLTITALTPIGYWLLFEKFKPLPLKIFGCAPACNHTLSIITKFSWPYGDTEGKKGQRLFRKIEALLHSWLFSFTTTELSINYWIV